VTKSAFALLEQHNARVTKQGVASAQLRVRAAVKVRVLRLMPWAFL